MAEDLLAHPSARPLVWSELFAPRHGGRLLAVGESLGAGRVTGAARYVAGLAQAPDLRAGEIALVEALDPTWAAALARAAAIVLNADDQVSRAAVGVLGLPAVLGAGDFASALWNGASVTVEVEAGVPGRVYQALTRPDRAAPRQVLPFL